MSEQDPRKNGGVAGFFEPQGTSMGKALRRTHALYDMAYTLVDFLAALLFIVGSVFFFYDTLVYAGTWMFLVGSVFFAIKPSIRLGRELAVVRQVVRERRQG